MKLIQAIFTLNLVIVSSVYGQQDVGDLVSRSSLENVPTTSTVASIGPDPSRPVLTARSNISSLGSSVGSSAALTFPGIGEINLPDLTAITLPPLFGPTPCFGTNLMAGQCQREAECTKSGGQSAGPCALNLGVCCTKTSQCGDTVRLNESIFTNPNYPEPSPLTDLCTMRIVKLPGVSQIRLDIVDLQIGEVDEGGKCSQDALVIEGLNPGFTAPRLCGFMANQHMYLPVDETAIGGTVSLRLIVSPVSLPRLFKIKVSQIALGSTQLAPPGCLQYHSSPSGVINSFNFESTKNVGIRSIGGLTYAICFRQEAGMCSVRFDPMFLGKAHSAAKRSIDPLAPTQMMDPLGAKHFPRLSKYVAYSSKAYPPKAYQGYQIKPSSPKTYNYRPKAQAERPYAHRPAPQRPVYRQRPTYKRTEESYQHRPSFKPRPSYPRSEQQPTHQQYQASYQRPAPQAPAPLKPYQVPVPEPAYQAPRAAYQAPAPRPAYQTPAPRPVYQAPRPHYQAPAPQPAYQAPAPRPTYQAPHQPAPQVPASYPSPVYAPVEEKVEVVIEKKIPDLIEAKVDLVKDLIDEKTRILNSLLNNTGTGLPSILPLTPGVGGVAVPAALPIVPIPQVPTITDAALKPFLPILPTAGIGSLGGSLLPGAPIDLTTLASCQGKDSIGFPPGAILCEDNARPVILSTAPFMVFVDNRGTSPSKGFSFSYRQQICS